MKRALLLLLMVGCAPCEQVFGEVCADTFAPHQGAWTSRLSPENQQCLQADSFRGEWQMHSDETSALFEMDSDTELDCTLDGLAADCEGSAGVFVGTFVSIGVLRGTWTDPCDNVSDIDFSAGWLQQGY